ncbi:hypothetical protein NBRC3293_1805 [Gluconobacter oxydans NBRC 3293]|uniref:Uncharacterized protein n=2 Tax=Gluconobacter oxydans TaxID=442 RepID=A0A829X398_GLUOY|nr:hypothetical protein GLS_c18510 [Gluconobacter oxydans DSM 3504]GEM17307.1 hypothetical protein NBRC3293_1805 [Gluconobacter oxydans NBRC 3293]
MEAHDCDRLVWFRKVFDLSSPERNGALSALDKAFRGR